MRAINKTFQGCMNMWKAHLTLGTPHRSYLIESKFLIAGKLADN